MEGKGVSTAVDEESNAESGDETNNDGDGGGSSRLRDRDTGDEDNGLKTFTENSDEGKEEKSPFSGPALALVLLVDADGALLLLGGGLDAVVLVLVAAEDGHDASGLVLLLIVVGESMLELDAPLSPRAVHTTKEGKGEESDGQGFVSQYGSGKLTGRQHP